MKADRLNRGKIRTLLVKYLVVSMLLSFPLLLLVAAKGVNTDLQEAVFSFSFDIKTLASINGELF